MSKEVQKSLSRNGFTPSVRAFVVLVCSVAMSLMSITAMSVVGMRLTEPAIIIAVPVSCALATLVDIIVVCKGEKE